VIVVLLVGVLPLAPCQAAKKFVPPARIIISLYNDANARAETIDSAVTIASRIFDQAGLAVDWMLCTPSSDDAAKSQSCNEVSFPRHLHVRILARSRTLAKSTFGVSYLSEDGTGCYADIFFAPVADLHAASGEEIPAILGHVIAHEIAHLLLGTNSHSPSGIMQGRWQAPELIRANKAQLLFTPEQALAMRRRLSTGLQGSAD
jgi:hypothetical protein